MSGGFQAVPFASSPILSAEIEGAGGAAGTAEQIEGLLGVTVRGVELTVEVNFGPQGSPADETVETGQEGSTVCL